MNGKLLLVGSIPLDSAEEVFETWAHPLGRYLGTVPDGEVGFRKHWISRVHYQVLALHPDIEVARYPAKEDGRERLNPRNAQDSWLFRLKPGTTRIRFGEPGWRLGFARDAINSYFVFRTLREQGRLAPHLRLQVCLPSPSSAVPPRLVPNAADLPILREGYEEALRSELETIVSRIPARDLAIQWDCATEVGDAYGPTGVEPNMPQIERLCPLVPEAAQLGFHLCFGTLGGWPRFAPDDLGRTVALANEVIARAGRRVDWVHIPLLDRTDDAFFAPLADLRPGTTRVFLGAIHNMQNFGARVAAARRFLPEFGVGAFCGFGRMPPGDMPKVLADHLQAMESFA